MNGYCKIIDALTKLSNEVLGSLQLIEPLARQEMGNTNYHILIQRAEEARAVLASASTEPAHSDVLDALHKARIELGAFLQVGAGPSTRRAFDAVEAAIAKATQTEVVS